MFRRRKLPADLAPAYEAFSAQAERVEAARRALLSCLPVGRVDPVPVPVGLDLVADELRAVREDLDVWRVPPLEQAWGACLDAVDEALAAVPTAHHVAVTTTELEVLLGAVGDVVEPLDSWGDAERAWHRLRARGSRGCPPHMA